MITLKFQQQCEIDYPSVVSVFSREYWDVFEFHLRFFRPDTCLEWPFCIDRARWAAQGGYGRMKAVIEQRQRQFEHDGRI